MRLESTGREATIEDLYREPGKAELVNGRIVRMPSASGLHGYAGLQIAASLTAYARREDRVQTLLAGYQIHVAKPVAPDELVTVVSILGGRGGPGYPAGGLDGGAAR